MVGLKLIKTKAKLPTKKFFRQLVNTVAAISLIASSLFISSAEAASRIKDIADFEGVRDNLLVGYGLVVGLNGTIWKTDNGGQSWLDMQSGSNMPLYGITGFGNTLVAVGDNTTVLHHRIGDASWNLLNDTSKSRTYLRGVTGLGGGQFVTAGGGVLFTISIPGNGALASLETLNE